MTKKESVILQTKFWVIQILFANVPFQNTERYKLLF
jgi:hypothetical protein